MTLSPVTVQRLIALAPNVLHSAELAAALNAGFAEHGLSPLEQAHFLAQSCHETQGFRRYEENLRYTSPERLDAMFSAVRGNADAAALIRRGPIAIANRVYAGRNGNGPEGTGDGWNFRGRGLFHLTGRANYRAAGAALGLPYERSPDMASQPDGAVRTALWFWKANGCGVPAKRDDVAGVTRIINGKALAGLEDRKALTARAKEIFT